MQTGQNGFDSRSGAVNLLQGAISLICARHTTRCDPAPGASPRSGEGCERTLPRHRPVHGLRAPVRHPVRHRRGNFTCRCHSEAPPRRWPNAWLRGPPKKWQKKLTGNARGTASPRGSEVTPSGAAPRAAPRACRRGCLHVFRHVSGGQGATCLATSPRHKNGHGEVEYLVGALPASPPPCPALVSKSSRRAR